MYVNKKTLGRLADKAVESELTDNGDAKIQAFSKLTQWLEETVLADVNTSTNMTEIWGQYN